MLIERTTYARWRWRSSGSYLDLHSIAHIDSDGVAAVQGGVKSRAGLRWSLDIAFGPGQVQLARNCRDKQEEGRT